MNTRAPTNVDPADQEKVSLLFEVRDSATGAPLPGCWINVAGDGFPSSGITDAAGQAQMQLSPLPVGLREYTVLVRPPHSYWNRIISAPDIFEDQPYKITLDPIAKSHPDFPKVARNGWGDDLVDLTAPPEFSGKGAKVAIIGSGVDTEHPHLGHGPEVDIAPLLPSFVAR